MATESINYTIELHKNDIFSLFYCYLEQSIQMVKYDKEAEQSTTKSPGPPFLTFSGLFGYMFCYEFYYKVDTNMIDVTNVATKVAIDLLYLDFFSLSVVNGFVQVKNE